MSITKKIGCVLFVGLLTAVLGINTARATVVAQYDASAVTNQRPDEVSPAWDTAGGGPADPNIEFNPTYISDDGDYLSMKLDDNDGSQSTNNGDYANWTSPASQTVTMTRLSGQYGIEVKLKPIGDFMSTGYSYEYANIVVRWSDDVSEYLISFDADSDDAGAGTTGKVSLGKYPMVAIIDNIDWSSPHTIGVIYEGAIDKFHFYLDDVYKASAYSVSVRIGATNSGTQNKVAFGDSTTGGYHPDYDAQWYFVRLHSDAFLTLPVYDPNIPVAEYDASAVTTLRPGEDTPAWAVSGNQTEAFGSDDMGDYLSLHLAGIGNETQNAGDSLYWTSPASTPMEKGVSTYGIEVKIQPVDDYISTGYAYEAQNMVVQWSDDTYWYSVSFDKDKDDAGAGTAGRIIRAKYGWTTIIDPVDWSSPHTLAIVYEGDVDKFHFYLDSVYKATWDPNDLQVGAVHAPYQDKVVFGDGTSGGGDGATYGPDYDSNWYFVRLYEGLFGGLELPVPPDPNIPVAEYDASKVATLRPGEVSPAWTVQGNQTEAFGSDDMGDYLSHHLAGIGNETYNSGDYLRWISPTTTPMENSVSDYGIEVRMQPVDDWISTGYSYEAQNMAVSWSDDVHWYMVSFDKDKDDDDPGTLGRIIRAKYGWTTIIDDVDWSTPHTLAILYEGATDKFHFYLDNVYETTLEPNDLFASGGAPYAPYQNKVVFGDGTTGGAAPDYDSDWYFVRLYSGFFGGLQPWHGACGDADHPYPLGDTNRDCIVDIQDLADIEQHWLDNNRP